MHLDDLILGFLMKSLWGLKDCFWFMTNHCFDLFTMFDNSNTIILKERNISFISRIHNSNLEKFQHNADELEFFDASCWQQSVLTIRRHGYYDISLCLQQVRCQQKIWGQERKALASVLSHSCINALDRLNLLLHR